MARATHQGECQVCGRVQKLPDDRLAKHGYKVTIVGFQGVCIGSGELPLEVSCNMIERAIESAQAGIEHMRAEIAHLLQPATEPHCWYHEYIPSTWERKGGYRWREIDIFVLPDTHGFYFTNHKEKPERLNYSGMYLCETALDVASMLNKSRAEALQREITKSEEYIAWQRGRVAAWKPRELTPIK